MDALLVRNKFDLKPWLVARQTKVFVILPVHRDEAKLHRQLLGLFNHFLPNLHVVILVDPDFRLSFSLKERIGNQYGKRVEFIDQKRDDAPGIVLLAGIAVALDRGAQKVIQLSSYSENEISHLPELLSFADQFDLVIGSRFLEKQEFACPQKQLQFKIDHWINATFLNRFLGGRITDANSEYRCWSRVALELITSRLQWRNPRLLNLEMTYLSLKMGLRFFEFPTAYKPTVTVNHPIPDFRSL